MNPITALLAALGAVTAVFLAGWGRMLRRAGQRWGSPSALETGTGAFTNFFDTLGIGLYAPCMILISLLGMNPKTAFPIMMGSCAFLMPTCGIRFIREGSYNLSAAVGLAIGGIPGVLLAAYIVKELSLDMVRWLVITVVVYTAVSMLWSAFRTSPDHSQYPQSLSENPSGLRD